MATSPKNRRTTKTGKKLGKAYSIQTPEEKQAWAEERFNQPIKTYVDPSIVKKGRS